MGLVEKGIFTPNPAGFHCLASATSVFCCHLLPQHLRSALGASQQIKERRVYRIFCI